jgi:DNA-binding CsgD family transcriptional regulator
MVCDYADHADRDINSAVHGEQYTDLPPTMRRLAHRAAAEALSGDAVWIHRVAAATGADESLAAELEMAAVISPPAGPDGPGPAQLLEWASDLSPDHEGRERRLLMAAIQRHCAGYLGPAGLWTSVQACAPSALRSCAMAGHALVAGNDQEAKFHLRRALSQAEEQHWTSPEQRGTLAAIRHGLHAALCLRAALGDQAAAAAAAGLAEASGDRGLERWLTRLLAAGRCYADGPRAALHTLTGRADRLAGEPTAVLELGCYQVLSGEPGQAVGYLSDLAAGAKAAGAAPPPGLRADASQWLALACHLSGAWPEAGEHAGFAISAARRSERPGATAFAIGALIAAHRAEWSVADEYLARAHERGGESADGAVLADVAEAATAHARGTPATGYPALDRLANGGDAARKYRSLWLPLRTEALVESGPERDAAVALASLLALADEVPCLRVPWHRLSGRLAERNRDTTTARRHYEAARELRDERLTLPLEAGLLEHCYGLMLCGLGDVAAGSASLSSACDRLASAGALPYAQRCAADLAARQYPGDAAASSGLLTDRERAVARLVAAGLTNQQTAARLYVSVRTVEYHLAQIYGKLGIKSRRQLARLRSLP